VFKVRQAAAATRHGDVTGVTPAWRCDTAIR